MTSPLKTWALIEKVDDAGDLITSLSGAEPVTKAGSVSSDVESQLNYANNLQNNKKASTLSSTSQVEAATGDKVVITNNEINELKDSIEEKKDKLASSDAKYHAAINNKIAELQVQLAEKQAELKKQSDFNSKATSKGFHHMINHHADGTFSVKIPFDMKDAFKKQFSSAKWDGTTKEWSVGKLSGQKLNEWLQDKIPHIEEKAAEKAAFEAKKSEMHPLSGSTFDIKDDLKAKFSAMYDSDKKTWRVPAEHKEAAQKFVNEHNTAAKADRAAKRRGDSAELSEEEHSRVDKWLDENPTESDLMMDDRYMRAIAKGGEIVERSGFGG